MNKKLLKYSLVVCAIISGIFYAKEASAWIGTGEGGSYGYDTSNGGENCPGNAWQYAIGCSGVSWAYYSTNTWSTSDTVLPYLNTEQGNALRVHGAAIPAECSQHEGNRGFWHFGINGSDIRIGDYGGGWNNMIYTGGWYGHWLTLNYGHYTASWGKGYTPPYIQGYRQTIGNYTLDHFGTTEEVLKRYQLTYMYDNPGAAAPTSIPGNVWGFCDGDWADGYTITIKAIDNNGNSLENMLPDRSFTALKDSSGTVKTINLQEHGYTKVKWGTSTNPNTWTDNSSLSYTYNKISNDLTIYAVYEPTNFSGRARIIEGTTMNNNKATSTGYVKTKSTKELSGLECKKTGCDITYDLYLRGSGVGDTEYLTGISSGGSTTWLPNITQKFSAGNKGDNSNRVYIIASALSPTMVMDVSGGVSGEPEKDNIQLYKQNDSDAQKWQLINNGDGTRTIKNYPSGRAVDVYSGSTANGTNIWLYESNSTPAQKWKVSKDGYKYIFSSELNNNKRIDVSGAGTSNGTNIWLYEKNTTPAQRWWLFDISNQTSGASTESPVSAGTEILLPGQKKCHNLKFKPAGSTSNTWVDPVGVCASAKDITFSGYSEVYVTNNSNTNSSTGWKSSGDISDNTAWLELKNCNDGCTVKFNHKIKQNDFQKNFSPSNWKITGTGADEGTFSNGAEKVVKTSDNITIKTGQVKCSTLKFENKITYNNSTNKQVITTASTRVCVYATGTVGSTIDMKAGKSASKLVDAPSSDPIYAKPTDIIYLKGTYTPTVQSTHNLVPKTITGAILINDNTRTLKNAFTYKGLTWRNTFSIYANSSPKSISFLETKKSNTLGSPNEYTDTSRSYEITTTDPGNTIITTAATNHMDTTKTAPKQITFTYTKDIGFTANVNNDAISDSSYIKVPYNFINKTDITTEDKSTVYAGETKTITYDVIVNTRENKTIGSTYATIVRGAKRKVKVCINNTTDCTETNAAENETFNSSGLLSGTSKSPDPKSTIINVPDVPAGTKIYVKSMVYPAHSGNDTNLDPKGSDSWAESSWIELVVAKRPNMQVLGGNVYTNGNITTGVSIKNNLAGIANYNVNYQASQAKYLFGSWGELGVISTGKEIKGLSSGAGLSTEPDNTTIRTSDKIIACPLSFATNNCSGTAILSGSIGSSSATEKPVSDKSAILNKLNSDSVAHLNSGATVSLTQDANMLDNGKYYYIGDGNLTINTSTVNKHTIYIVKVANGTVTINGNIDYEGDYSTFEDMAKLVIYAKNISINCNVDYIHGLLIAEDTVRTCNSDNINARDNSRQLTIHGAVITNKLIPNRTYGAATGSNSGVPAEIINFDPSLYRWNTETVEGSTDIKTNLEATQIRELAPRL